VADRFHDLYKTHRSCRDAPATGCAIRVIRIEAADSDPDASLPSSTAA